MLDSLSDKGKLAKVERDYMLVLADQVEKYEQKRYPMGDVSDVEMLRYLIETHGTTQAEVARGSGVNATTLSSILAGRRKMAREHVEALCRHFHVGPAVFLTDLCSSKS